MSGDIFPRVNRFIFSSPTKIIIKLSSTKSCNLFSFIPIESCSCTLLIKINKNCFFYLVVMSVAVSHRWNLSPEICRSGSQIIHLMSLQTNLKIQSQLWYRTITYKLSIRLHSNSLKHVSDISWHQDKSLLCMNMNLCCKDHLPVMRYLFIISDPHLLP